MQPLSLISDINYQVSILNIIRWKLIFNIWLYVTTPGLVLPYQSCHFALRYIIHLSLTPSFSIFELMFEVTTMNDTFEIEVKGLTSVNRLILIIKIPCIHNFWYETGDCAVCTTHMHTHTRYLGKKIFPLDEGYRRTLLRNISWNRILSFIFLKTAYRRENPHLRNKRNCTV